MEDVSASNVKNVVESTPASRKRRGGLSVAKKRMTSREKKEAVEVGDEA